MSEDDKYPTIDIRDHLEETGHIPPATNGKPDAAAWRAQLAGEVTEAEKELTRDQKALEAAEAKVTALKADVKFDEMKVASRAKGLATFDALRAKAEK